MSRILLVADNKNKRGYYAARHTIDGAEIWLPKTHYKTHTSYISSCKTNKIDTIILCDDVILRQMLVAIGKVPPDRDKVSCQQWAGACFVISNIRVIVTRGFGQLLTTTTGKFIFKRHVYKHLYPSFSVPDLEYEVIHGKEFEKLDAMEERLSKAKLIAVDIETCQTPVSPIQKQKLLDELGEKALRGITTTFVKGSGASKKYYEGIPEMFQVGYAGLFQVGKKFVSFSYVVYIDSWGALQTVRRVNANSVDKIMQNGGYDSTYFCRYNAPLENFLWDTFHMMHSWYVELPRTLDFLAGFFLPNYEYWKDQAGYNEDYYNAMDTHNTLWVFMFQIMEMPEWAKTNYLIEFRKIFPNLTMGLEGLKVDLVERERLRVMYQKDMDEALERLQRLVHPTFNPSSSQQVKALMQSLAMHFKITSSDEKSMNKWRHLNPINNILTELILTYREKRKALSTYIEARLYEGRLLYELNAGGTKTGRSASKASNLWVGTQIQNQDNKLRDMYIADSGWALANNDGSQAESRTTAYISGDANLIDAVENAPDFHTRNASMFFGIPEEEIQKPVRTLSKRVNHGSNYNMSEFMLIETMGSEKVIEAKHLLGLPSDYSLFKVAQYLLATFVEAYPDVKGKYYDEVIEEVELTSMLQLPFTDDTPRWTRYCFGTPDRSRGGKKHLNEYVAHMPQSMNVMILDEALFDFWYEYQIKQRKVRLKAQIHDEIMYQVRSLTVSLRIGTVPFRHVDTTGILSPDYHLHTKQALIDLMGRPVEVRGRKLVIPSDGGGIDLCMGNLKD